MAEAGRNALIKGALESLKARQKLVTEKLQTQNANASVQSQKRFPNRAAQKANKASSLDEEDQNVEELELEKLGTKINNSKDNCSLVFNICDALEKVLNDLDLSENELVYDKLISIQNLITKKIFSLDDEKQELDNLSSSCSLSSIPKTLELNDDLGFQRFMKTLTCPFCSETQDDKITLIKHIDEDCRPHLTKTIKIPNHLSYAEFQILANNTFKCNYCKNSVQTSLKHLYFHKQKQSHVKAVAAGPKGKNYTECLFCSCCKVLVHNNYTEINFHIEHEVHKKKKASLKDSHFYLQQGIHCVFGINKRFKCLDCPAFRVPCTTPKGILSHIESLHHIMQKSTKYRYEPFMYCDVCLKKVHIQQVIHHFTSNAHQVLQMKVTETTFELCFYCGFVCKDLMELSFHMKSECVDIKSIRQSILKLGEPKQPALKKSQVTDASEGDEDFITGSSIITVKDYSNMAELFKYFGKFGEILSIEPHNDKDMVVHFREKSAVNDILLLKDVLKIGGVKIKIVNGLPREHFKIEPERENFNGSRDKSSGASNLKERNDNTVLDNANSPVENDGLDDLLQRVSAHLINNTKKMNSSVNEKLLFDCRKTLESDGKVEVNTCDFVGFYGCELSFPFETANVICSFKQDSFHHTDVIIKNLLRKCYQNLSSSELWTDIELCSEEEPFPYIKCVHKETEKTCTITFSLPTLLLTSMLKDCMEKNDHVQHFCLIVRFWLSVHQLKIRNCEYALISLIVFFLMNKKVVEISTGFEDSNFLKEFYDSFDLSESQGSKTFTVKELFLEFLHFLSAFDFHKCAILLPNRLPLLKTAFTTSKFKIFSGIKQPAPLLSCSMCILDPISLINLAKNIKMKDQKEMLDIINSTIEHNKFQ